MARRRVDVHLQRWVRIHHMYKLVSENWLAQGCLRLVHWLVVINDDLFVVDICFLMGLMIVFDDQQIPTLKFAHGQIPSGGKKGSRSHPEIDYSDHS